jgi:hypothetical protein
MELHEWEHGRSELLTFSWGLVRRENRLPGKSAVGTFPLSLPRA